MTKETQSAVAAIPWQTATVWTEVQMSIQHICSSLGEREECVRSIGRRIQRGYAEIAAGLELLCADTCVECSEVCCCKATVWYDLPDLLFLYLTDGLLPSKQIIRRTDHSCINLGHTGCMVERDKRPFICTWYICAAQKEVLTGLAATDSVRAVRILIEDIKEARKELETTCIEAVCGCIPGRKSGTFLIPPSFP